MSADEYVPSDQDIEDTYASTWLNFQNELGRERFRSWLVAHDARVRRDAAREALDGYADALSRNRSAAVWGWPEFVTDVREWAAYNYPEEAP